MTKQLTAAHTPGPWLAAWNGTCWQIDAKLDAVATTQFCFAPGTEANARLIAAAPELLARLELALRYLEHPEVQAIPFALAASAVAEQCRFVIAKATEIT